MATTRHERVSTDRDGVAHEYGCLVNYRGRCDCIRAERGGSEYVRRRWRELDDAGRAALAAAEGR